MNYMNFGRELVDMWDVESAITVPIVKSAHGLIAQSLDQYLQMLTLESWIKSPMQKAVLFNTPRIVGLLDVCLWYLDHHEILLLIFNFLCRNVG